MANMKDEMNKTLDEKEAVTAFTYCTLSDIEQLFVCSNNDAATWEVINIALVTKLVLAAGTEHVPGAVLQEQEVQDYFEKMADKVICLMIARGFLEPVVDQPNGVMLRLPADRLAEAKEDSQ